MFPQDTAGWRLGGTKGNRRAVGNGGTAKTSNMEEESSETSKLRMFALSNDLNFGKIESI